MLLEKIIQSFLVVFNELKDFLFCDWQFFRKPPSDCKCQFSSNIVDFFFLAF